MVKVQNIKVGDVYKSYRQMCEVLEEKTKGGNSKKAQLAEWERYFRYSKDGNKFIIEDVYEKPLTKDKQHGGARRTLAHADLMDRYFLYILHENNGGNIFLSTNSLLGHMNMINQNYRYANDNRDKTAIFLNIDENIVNEFFNISRRTFIYNIESMLKRLENKALILWEKVITVCKSEREILYDENGNPKVNIEYVTDNRGKVVSKETIKFKRIDQYREASTQEKDFILKTEGLVLDELGFDDKKEVVANGKWNEYLMRINKILSESKYQISFYYKSYKITQNDERIVRKLMSENELEGLNLNNMVQIQIIENTELRHQKAELELLMDDYCSNEKILIRGSDEYIKSNERLIKEFIDLSAQSNSYEIRKVKLTS